MGVCSCPVWCCYLLHNGHTHCIFPGEGGAARLSHHRGSAIYIIMKVRTATQRVTQSTNVTLHVCAARKKKRANNQHDKNKKMLDKKQTSCLFQPLHNKAKNTYFATSVKQLKKHQHGFRTHKNPQNKFGKASDRGGGGECSVKTQQACVLRN